MQPSEIAAWKQVCEAATTMTQGESVFYATFSPVAVLRLLAELDTCQAARHPLVSQVEAVEVTLAKVRGVWPASDG